MILKSWSVTETEKDGEPVISLSLKLVGFDSTEQGKDFIPALKRSILKETGQTLIVGEDDDSK